MSDAKECDREPTPTDEPRLQIILEILDALPFYAMLVDEDHRIVAANQVVQAYLGKPAHEIIGCYCPKLIHDTEGPFPGCPVEECIDCATPVETEMNDERYGLWFRSSAYPMRHRTPDGRRIFLHFIRDITEQKRAHEERAQLEDQLAQSQRLEAIGRVAGGVAHDFNNLLTVILNFAALSARQVDDRALQENMLQIERAAQRAIDLTRKLLTFSRKQVVEPAVLRLDAVVRDLSELLKSIVGDDVTVKLETDLELWHVMADVGQIERVLVNLAVNARDAMSASGELTVWTRNVELREESHAAAMGLGIGRYVAMEVSDTGAGMPPDVLPYLFEPFFTTKEAGKGTGLGLSLVYGIVAQAGGAVTVASEPGAGSQFSVYLPVTDDTVRQTPANAAAAAAHPGGRTILVVDDNDMIVTVTAQILQAAGYTVLEANSGEQAIERSAAHAGPIDLLVTDLVMPGISGAELAEQIEQTRPGTPVLYISGYGTQILLPGSRSSVPFIQKPFRADDLLRIVAQALAPSLDADPSGKRT